MAWSLWAKACSNKQTVSDVLLISVGSSKRQVQIIDNCDMWRIWILCKTTYFLSQSVFLLQVTVDDFYNAQMTRGSCRKNAGNDSHKVIELIII